MDPNTLDLDPDPEFCSNLDPDPGLGYVINFENNLLNNLRGKTFLKTFLKGCGSGSAFIFLLGFGSKSKRGKLEGKN